jgi:hypothetical protein
MKVGSSIRVGSVRIAAVSRSNVAKRGSARNVDSVRACSVATHCSAFLPWLSSSQAGW